MEVGPEADPARDTLVELCKLHLSLSSPSSSDMEYPCFCSVNRVAYRSGVMVGVRKMAMQLAATAIPRILHLEIKASTSMLFTTASTSNKEPGTARNRNGMLLPEATTR